MTMFRHQLRYKTLLEAGRLMKSIQLQVCALSPRVKTLLQLLFISPVSSCSAERTFGRLLIRPLRSTTTQTRLILLLCVASISRISLTVIWTVSPWQKISLKERRLGVTFLEVRIELLILSFGTDSDTVSSSHSAQISKTSTAE